MVSSLLHAARATHPDIAHAVGLVSKVNAALTQAYLTAIKRTFRYLKGIIDVNYITDQPMKSCEGILMQISRITRNRHSTTSIAFIVSGGAISWLSQKQATIYS